MVFPALHGFQSRAALCFRVLVFMLVIGFNLDLRAQITIQPFTDPTCLGNSVSLAAVVTSTEYGTDSYSFQIIPYAPLDTTIGTPVDQTLTHCTSLSGGKDDCWGGPYDIGFSFCFFSQLYTQFYVGSNGWIGFRSPGNNPWNTFTARVIPNNAADSAAPKNCIFAPWQDWLPTLQGTNNIFYYVTGTAPDRQLVVYWKMCPMYGCVSTKGSFQIVLKEQGGVIENHLQSKPLCGNSGNVATQGVHNNNGTIAFTAVVNGVNRNRTSWTATQESMRFVPDGVSWHKGSPTGMVLGYGDSLTFTPVNNTWVYAVINTCQGVIHYDSALIHVVPTLTGPSTLCKGSTGVTYVTEGGMTNYVWSISSGGTITYGGTSTDSTVTVTWNGAGSQTVGIIFTNPVTGCTSSIVKTLSVTVKDTPVPLLTGTQSICVNSQGQVYTTNAGKLNYVWTVTGGSVIAGGGSSNSTCTVLWNTPGAQTIGVSYTDPVTLCAALTPTILPVAVNPLPVPAFTTGETSVCKGVPGKLYETLPGQVNYIWSVTGGSITGGGTSSSSTATVTWNTVGSQTISVNYSIPVTLCTAPAPVVLPVQVHELPVPVITGSSEICMDQPQATYATDPEKTGYLWSIVSPGAGSIVSGASTNAVLIHWNNPGTHSLRVNYTDNNSCTALNPTQFAVVVTPVPNSVITVTPGVSCATQTHVYQTTPDPACSFTWTINPPANGTVSIGQGTNMVTIDWLMPGSATLGVTASNNTYTCYSSSSVIIPVKPTPVPQFVSCFDLKTTINARKIILRGASPFMAGQSIFSGYGVSNPSPGIFEFNPQVAGPGTSLISYAFTNTYGCTGTAASIGILVQNPAFTCGGILTDIRDGKTYPTSQLAGKCWMTKNLDYGTILPGPSPSAQTDNCIVEKYCAPADPACTSYGGFYQWNELMNYEAVPGAKGICPPEWHVPTESEWQTLIDNLVTGIPAPDANGLAGAKLKDINAISGFHSFLPGLNYLSAFWSYTALPLTGAMYWTSSLVASGQAVARGVNLLTPSISYYPRSTGNAFPVRCIKD